MGGPLDGSSTQRLLRSRGLARSRFAERQHLCCLAACLGEYSRLLAQQLPEWPGYGREPRDGRAFKKLPAVPNDASG
eukprot:9454205-Prorocentrum_lima.AAC.1